MIQPTQSFVPVVVGADAGSYSIARAFHAEYGVRTVVVSRQVTGPIKWSRIVEHSACAEMSDDAALLEHLLVLGRELAEVPGSAQPRQLLLLGCADALVRRLLTMRDALQGLFVLPYVDLELFDRLSDKARFAGLCAELDVAHPATAVVDLANPDDGWRALTGPYVVKPVDAPLYAELQIDGAEKVHSCPDAASVARLLGHMRAGGYDRQVVVQTRIPGDDQNMRILTCYSDRTGKVRFASFGKVLLEQHTPTTQGNPAAILTDVDATVVGEAVRLLEHVGWVGYANFDLKVDPTTGRTAFFELNPRLGRSNYYLTGAGYNVARLYARDWLLDQPLTGHDRLVVAQREFLYTIVPTALLTAYVTDPQSRRGILSAMRHLRTGNPLLYPADADPRRVARIKASQYAQVAEFARYYSPSDARAAADLIAPEPGPGAIVADEPSA